MLLAKGGQSLLLAWVHQLRCFHGFCLPNTPEGFGFFNGTDREHTAEWKTDLRHLKGITTHHKVLRRDESPAPIF